MEVIRLKTSAIGEIPLSKIPDPGMKKAFDFRALGPETPLNRQVQDEEAKALLLAGNQVIADRLAALHWCFKMAVWHKHQIPAKTAYVNLHRDSGVFLRSIFELSIRCYKSDAPECNQYADGYEWFHCIFREFVLNDLQGLTEGEGGKNKTVATQREKIAAISGKNESDGDTTRILSLIEAETPHFHRLIKRAQRVSRGDKTGDFWRVYMTGKGNPKMRYPHVGLITAWKRWITFQEKSDFYPIWVEGKDILHQTGKGRTIKRIEPKLVPPVLPSQKGKGQKIGS